MIARKRILILSDTASQAARLQEAAEKLALDTVLGCRDNSGTLQLDFDTRDSALTIVSFIQQSPVVAIVPVGDLTGPVAARAASMLRFSFHTPKAGDTCKDKQRLLKALRGAGLTVWSGGTSPEENSISTTLHCLMTEGRLRVLAVTQSVKRPVAFESIKPDTRQLMIEAMKRMIPGVGLRHGPVRLQFATDPELAIADVSATYIADESNGALHFQIPLVDQDVSFEELAIRNALGLDTGRAFLKVQ